MGVYEDLTSNNSNQSNSSNTASNDNKASKTGNPFTSQQELDYLKSIDNTLKDLLKQSRNTSQSDAKYSMPRRDDFQQSRTYRQWAPSSNRYNRTRGHQSYLSNNSFIDGFQSAILESFLGSDFKDKIKDSLNDFADLIGVDLRDVPNTLGKELGKQLAEGFKRSSIGQQVFDSINKRKGEAVGWAKDKFNQGVDRYNRAHGTNYNFNRDAARSGATSSNSAATSATDASDKVKQQPDDLSGRAAKVSAQSINIVADSVIVTESSVKSENLNDSLQAAQEYVESTPKTDTPPVDNLQDATLSTIDSNSNSQSFGEQDVPDLSYLVDGAKTDIQNQASDLLGDRVTKFFDGLHSKFKNFLGDNPLGSLKDKFGPLFGSDATQFASKAATQVGTSAAESTAIQAVNSSASTSMMAAESMQAGAGAAEVASTASGAGAALEGLASIAGAVGPVVLAAVAAFVALTLVVNALSPAIEGTKKLLDKMGEASDRYTASRKKKMEESEKRFQADIESMIKEPFNILEEAAQNVYDAWDKNVRLINGTQGYTKADLQDLMSSYSQRLRDEGLTSVISASDITENLTKVLESGLSGKAAEEFAYLATKLNAEIPSQDFFGYADTYASIAAIAIKTGASQSEAIQYANSQLEDFASNVLYANRELAGGFTTGLKDAESLFDQAVQIAQTAKTNNSSEISGVLTSVAAITGSIAPDLAKSITDVIYKAATGGNSTDLVSLRSLARTGASNSDFLRAFAADPQSVMTTLFTNLASLQNMSDSNSMEVAEALSDLFGISMDAFSRVDFNYLAQAISAMNVNNASLDENLSLLKSGETTTTAEKLRMQQINEYLLDEGLSYVLDNEVARAVQQHMWDEQLALEMQEATYGVELQGAALEFLEGIRETVDNIVNLINPFSWGKKIANLIGTTQEVYAQEGDIRQLLELGKVGNGNRNSLYQLTTRGTDLNLTDSIITLMGGISAYELASANRKIVAGMFDPYNALLDNSGNMVSGLLATAQQALTYDISQSRNVDSLYNWSIMGKSAAKLLLGNGYATGATVPSGYTSQSASTAAAQSEVAAKIEKMLSDDYLQDKFINAGKSYQDWADSAVNFGISDIGKALEDAGYSEVDVQNYFQQKEVEQGNNIQQTRYEDEQDFRDKGRQFWIDEAEYTLQIIDLVTNTNTKLDTIIEQFVEFHGKWDAFRKDFTWKQFYADWTDYFINHTVYNKSYDYTSVDKIFRDEKKSSEDAIYALAEAFKTTTKDLKDPTVQTNALLSQILVVVNAIMQQNNSPNSGGLSLVDTLSALSTGLVKEV